MRLCEKLQQTVGEGLEYWFLTGEDLPPNDKAISGDTFGFHNLRQGELLLAANGLRYLERGGCHSSPSTLEILEWPLKTLRNGVFPAI